MKRVAFVSSLYTNKRMKQARIFFSAFAGTTCMTAWSYLAAWIQHNRFEEPVILGQLLNRLPLPIKKKTAHRAGWCMHYLVGLLFAENYAALWQNTTARPTNRNGLILGGISGLAAILIWKFTLSIHPDPPAIDFIPFAAQLFIAHLVFGLFATIGYNAFQ